MMEEDVPDQKRSTVTPVLVIVAGAAVMLASQLVMIVLGMSCSLFEDGIIANLYAAFFGQMIAAFAVIIFFIPKTGVKDVEYSSPTPEGLKRTLLWYIAAVGIVTLGGFILLIIFAAMGVVPETGYEGALLLEPHHLDNPMNIIIFFAVGSLGAPVFEELLFRRTAIPLLERVGLSPRDAVLSTSIAFAVVHVPLDILNGNVAGAIVHFWSTFILGATMGLLYVTTRNIIFPIIMHAITNGLSFAAVIGPLEIAAVIGLLYLAFIPIGLIIIKREYDRFKENTDNDWVIELHQETDSTHTNKLWKFILGFVGLTLVVTVSDLILQFSYIPIDIMLYLMVGIAFQVLVIIVLSIFILKKEG